MSINLRIIPRLDIRNNKLIKPLQLEGVKEIGDPETFAYNYYKQNADEILIMDVVASLYSRNNKADIVKKISNKVLVPVIVGGGIRNLDDAEILFNSGADKIALNTAVFDSPNLIKKLSKKYGSQSIVLSIEAKKNYNKNYWEALTNNGRDHSGYEIIKWAKKAIKLGIGEILLTSVDRDGTRKGFELELIKYFVKNIKIPVIISGGMCRLEELKDIYNIREVNGISIGAMLHYKMSTIKKIKDYSKNIGFKIRA